MLDKKNQKLGIGNAKCMQPNSVQVSYHTKWVKQMNPQKQLYGISHMNPPLPLAPTMSCDLP